MATRRSKSGTRENLLAAASEIFAQKGYKDATIKEICRLAKANIAAVNYHFSDKKTLYRETWRCCFAKSMAAHPPGGGVDENAAPEARLRGFVKAFLGRISDKDNREFDIVIKERYNPTGLLNEVMLKDLHPQFRKMEVLVRELIGQAATPEQVVFCGVSVISQCVDAIAVSRGIPGKNVNKGDFPMIKDIEAYTDHVVRFSLAGMRAVREEAEKKERGHSRK